MAVLLDYSQLAASRKAQKTLTFLIQTQYVVVSATMCDGSFSCFDKGSAEVLISLLDIGGARRY